jgi:hypothetical protein
MTSLVAPAPDSSVVEEALMEKLRSDPQLKALCPDGVWWDSGDEKSKRFVVCSLVDHSDVAVFAEEGKSGRAWEDNLFLVKAVMLNSAGGSVRAAAARIDALLNDQTLEVGEGLGFMAMFRERRIRITETDSENSAVRWLHRGGHYRVQVSLI